MDAFLRDLRLALRSASRQPLLTAVVVLTLALGIGANAAIFSMIRAVLLQPLDYERPDRLVTLWQDHSRLGGPADEWYSWDNFADYRRSSRSFSSMTAIGGWLPTLTESVEAEELQGAAVSWTFFDTFGREPAIGRSFIELEDLPEGERVLLLGDHLWRRRFGGDPGVVGEEIQLQGRESWRVVGVMPPGFEVPFVGVPDVIRPLRISPSNSCGRGCINLRVVGRLADGATLEGAREELSVIAEGLGEQYPESNEGVEAHLVPLHDRVTGPVRTPLLLLLGAVGLVLLIATANVAGLQLTRALRRRNELALRSALGASRLQIVRQLLVESLVWAAFGGIAGVAVAYGGIGLLRRLAAESAPRLADAALDAPTLAFGLLLTLLTGALFGALPAMRGARFDLSRRLREGNGGHGGERTRAALVVAEVALATLLLVGAGLFGRSLLNLFQLDLGYRAEGVLLARVGLGGEAYREPEARRAFTAAVLERLRALPGVVSASHTSSPPLSGFNWDSDFEIEGRAESEGGRSPVGWLRVVDDQYFQTLGVRVLEGRAFTAGDRDGAPKTVLLNETAVRRYFSGVVPSSILGQRINFNSDVEWREVIGIVADTRHFGLAEPPRPTIYVPWKQSPLLSPYFLVRTEEDPSSIVATLRAVVSEHDPKLAVAGIDTLGRVVGGATSTERLLASLLALFAACALLLASIGLYGVMSHAVEQRRRELGIRLALGADGARLRTMVLRGGLLLVAIGLAVGLAGAVGSGRLMESTLFGIRPWDPLTFAVVPIVLGLVGVLALWLPARRAARAEVLTVLRCD